MKKQITRIAAFVMLVALLAASVPAFALSSYSGTGKDPQKTRLFFDNGSYVDVYAVNVLDYVSSVDNCTELSGERISFGDTMGRYFKLYGNIYSCYGLAVDITPTEKTNSKLAFKVGLLNNRKGDYGDYHSEAVLAVNETGTLKCYNKEVTEINGFKVMGCQVRSSYSFSYDFVGLTLYFGSLSAANAYINSISY